MRKSKGCANESCEAHKMKIRYKESESFCSKCASPLVYVCKECYTQMPGDTEKFCVRCLAKHKDRIDKAKKVSAKVCVGAVGVGGYIIANGKKILDAVKKVKG